jgi:hypothetical protein
VHAARLVALVLAAVVPATVGVLAGSASANPRSTLYDNVDSGLCSFPVEAVGVGSSNAHFGKNGLIFSGNISITLRNLSTGSQATVSTPQNAHIDFNNNTIDIVGHQLITSANGIPVGFLEGRTVLDGNTFTITSQSGRKGAQSPCELLGAPAAAPRTTAAPWDAPVDAVAGMELAGLTPLFASLVKHVHSHLAVLVDGAPVTVPAGIGLGEPVDQGGGFFESMVGVFSPLHTHTADGIVHVEADSPPLDLTLGQFFDEWQVRLTPQCLGGYCNGAGKTLRAYVNGTQVADPRSIPMTDHADIVLVYGLPGVPATLPVYSGPWPS